MAREVLDFYRELDAGARLEFFQELARHYGPDREKLAEYSEMYRRLGPYPYDRDPLRPCWTPTIPNERWADPGDDCRPQIPY